MQIRRADRDPLASAAGRPDRTSLRAAVVLRLATGAKVSEVAASLGCAPATVRLWARRYQRFGMSGLDDRPRSGRPVVVPESLVLTLSAGLGDAHGRTSWTARALASQAGISPHTVLRVWRKWGLTPASSTGERGLTEALAAASAFEGLIWDAPRLLLAVSIGEPPPYDPGEELVRALRAAHRPVDDWGIDSHGAEHGQFSEAFGCRSDIVLIGTGGIHDQEPADLNLPTSVTWADLMEVVAACRSLRMREADPLDAARRQRLEYEQWWPSPSRLFVWHGA